MARVSLRARRARVDFWPGFVDAMATLLLVITFLLAIFALGQFILTNLLSGSERRISQLQSRIDEIAQALALEKTKRSELENKQSALIASLAQKEEENRRMQQMAQAERTRAEAGIAREVLLAQQLSAIEKQLVALNKVLEASREEDRKNKTRIKTLSEELNLALARKAQELARYRSEFMATLRDLLKDRKGFEVVGDRFILRSEILFNSGSASINSQGKTELREVAQVIKEVGQTIPPRINWVMRVDGHTDIQPIRTKAFPSNWHLSVGRAVGVVEFLISQGVEPKRLVATGFGEYRPIKSATDPGEWQRNRRIEFKLTQK